jgi:hypothetical protein
MKLTSISEFEVRGGREGHTYNISQNTKKITE